jgi:hypothetical protein
VRELRLQDDPVGVLALLELVAEYQIIVEHRSEGAFAVVLHQLLPVFNHDFDHSHEFRRHFHGLLKVVKQLIYLLDADSSLLDFKEDVNCPLLAVLP